MKKLLFPPIIFLLLILSLNISAQYNVVDELYSNNLTKGTYSWDITFTRDDEPVTEIIEGDIFGVVNGSQAIVELTQGIGNYNISAITQNEWVQFSIDDEVRDIEIDLSELAGVDFTLNLFRIMFLPTIAVFDDGTRSDLLEYSSNNVYPIFYIDDELSIAGEIVNGEYVIDLFIGSLQIKAAYELGTGIMQFWNFTFGSDIMYWEFSGANNLQPTNSDFTTTFGQLISTSEDPNNSNTNDSALLFLPIFLLFTFIYVKSSKNQ